MTTSTPVGVFVSYDQDQQHGWTLGPSRSFSPDHIVLGPDATDVYHARRLALHLLKLSGAITPGETADRLDDLIDETRAAIGDNDAAVRLRRAALRARRWATRARRLAETATVCLEPGRFPPFRVRAEDVRRR